MALKFTTLALSRVGQLVLLINACVSALSIHKLGKKNCLTAGTFLKLHLSVWEEFLCTLKDIVAINFN